MDTLDRAGPEALGVRRRVTILCAALERHGGVVEKFIGDAVLAVFGLPRLHADDALRAVRAAVEMQTALPGLNEELERDFGVTIDIGIGINTGEVVSGDVSSGDTFATGEAVNIAARLQSAAVHGEILIGAPTQRLVRDTVRTERGRPLALRGKPGRTSSRRRFGSWAGCSRPAGVC